MKNIQVENEAAPLELGRAAWSQTQINKTLLSSSFGLTSAPSAQRRLAELDMGISPIPSPAPLRGHVEGRHIWSSWCQLALSGFRQVECGDRVAPFLSQWAGSGDSGGVKWQSRQEPLGDGDTEGRLYFSKLLGHPNARQRPFGSETWSACSVDPGVGGLAPWQSPRSQWQ